MKTTYKALAMAMVMMVMASFSLAADSVDIGMGSMDRAEFQALQQMVRGDYRSTASVTTEVPRQIHVAEFSVRDIESIRQAMAPNRDQDIMTASRSQNELVDIGLGSMSTNEFCDLNKLVASNTAAQSEGFTFICP